MTSINKLILIVVLIAAFASLFFIPRPTAAPQVPTLQIGQASLNIEVADTPELRRQGLSGRPSLASNLGVLFQFPVPGKYSFWMRGMQFDLDFIWIANGKVIEITPNVLAEMGVADMDLRVYAPQTPADSMVEVNSGWAAQNGIQVGDRVKLTLPQTRP